MWRLIVLLQRGPRPSLAMMLWCSCLVHPLIPTYLNNKYLNISNKAKVVGDHPQLEWCYLSPTCFHSKSVSAPWRLWPLDRVTQQPSYGPTLLHPECMFVWSNLFFEYKQIQNTCAFLLVTTLFWGADYSRLLTCIRLVNDVRSPTHLKKKKIIN